MSELEKENIEKELTDESILADFSSEVLDAVKAYMLEIKQYPLLTQDEFDYLFEQFMNGSVAARNKIVESNLRLVVKVVGKYGKTTTALGFLDLVQEGNIALMNAVDHFDPSLGFKFSTFAYTAIQRRILGSYYTAGEAIRIPDYMRSSYYKYCKFKNDYIRQYGKKPNEDIIKEQLNISDNRYRRFLDIENNLTNLTSLDATVSNEKGDKETTKISDLVALESDFVQDLLANIDNTSLLQVLKENLNKKEYYVLYYRFIYDSGKTLQEIAKILKVSRSYIRQIEISVLKKAKKFLDEHCFVEIDNVDISPELFEKIVILHYLRDKISPYDYYLLYNIWYKGKSVTGVYSDIKREYLDVLKRYHHILNDYDNFVKIRDKLLETTSINQIFDLNITPINAKQFNFIGYINQLSYQDIINILGDNYQKLGKHKRLIDQYFNKDSLETVSLEMIENVLRFLNLEYLGINNEKETLPLDVLYRVLKENKDKFSLEMYEYMEGTYFRVLSGKRVPYDSSKQCRLDFTIYRLETIYYHIDDYFKYEISSDDLIQIIHDKKYSFPDEAIDILMKKCVDGMSINELALEYQMDYSKMRDYFTGYYDKAIDIYLHMGVRVKNDKADRYKTFILNPKYMMTGETREVSRLYFIENMTYKEIAEQLGISSTTRVSNILTDCIRKMDMWYYHVILEDIYPDDRVYELLEYSDNYSDLDKQIIINRFVYGICSEDNASLLQEDKRYINRCVSEFNKRYLSYYAKKDLSVSEIEKEVNLPLCDSVLNLLEKKVLSMLYGFNNEYNEFSFPVESAVIKDKLQMDVNKLSYCKRGALGKIGARVEGIIKPEFSTYTKDELTKLLFDPHLPITDYEKELLRSIKGIDCEMLSVKDLALKYQNTMGSIRRRIDRAFLSIKKYENYEIEGKFDYELDIVPYMRYFPLFEQDILKRRFQDNLNVGKVAAIYHLDRNSVRRIERRLYYLMRYPDAKKFDFDYARKVMHCDDLPFYGYKDKAISLYTARFRDDEKYFGTKSNFEASTSTSLYIKSLMIAVLKYRDGIRKKVYFSKEEIDAYYSKYKDRYTIQEQKVFETTLAKMHSALEFPVFDYQNKFVNYEMCKHNGLIHFTKDSSAAEIKKVIIGNPYHLSSHQLKILRNYFGIGTREFMNGKDKNKLIKFITPYIFNSLKKEKTNNKEQFTKGALEAKNVDASHILLKKDLYNNIKKARCYFASNLKDDKVLLLTDDVDYIFAYIYNKVANIDVKSTNVLSQMLYELKNYVIHHYKNSSYQKIFRGRLMEKHVKSFRDMDSFAKGFWMGLCRLDNANCVFEQDLSDAEYQRRSFVSNVTPYRNLGYKNSNVHFIDQIEDTYQEINFGKNIEALSIDDARESVFETMKYLNDDGVLISYFSANKAYKIGKIFKGMNSSRIKISSSYPNERKATLVLVKK